MKRPDLACIIDDDKMFTYLLSKQMKGINFSKNLLVFHNGLEALKYLKPILESPDSLPDVILLDLNMPVMDGWQFLDEFIKFKVTKKVTVYIVSSSINTEDHKKALTYEAVSDFYVKPVTQNDLVEMLAEMQDD